MEKSHHCPHTENRNQVCCVCNTQLSVPHHQIKQTQCLLFREHGWCLRSQDPARVPGEQILSLVFWPF